MTRPGPIVLLPPLGHDAALYAPLARALAPALDVVCLDYPGFGGNAALDLAAPDLLERLAQYFVAAIARLSRPPEKNSLRSAKAPSATRRLMTC